MAERTWISASSPGAMTEHETLHARMAALTHTTKSASSAIDGRKLEIKQAVDAETERLQQMISSVQEDQVSSTSGDASTAASSETDRLYRTIASLREHLNEVLSPIARLPDDALFAVFDTIANIVESDVYHPWNISYPNDHDAPHRHSIRLIIILSHVCRRWRALTLSHASFWRTVNVDEPLWTELALERSKSTPLCITCHNSGDKMHPDRRARRVALLQRALASPAGVKKLRLDVLERSDAMQVCGYFSTGSVHLEHVALCVEEEYNDDRQVVFWNFPDASSSESDGTGFLPNSRSLRVLRLSGVTVDDWPKRAAQWPTLLMLDIALYKPSPADEMSLEVLLQTLALLPMLKRLRLGGIARDLVSPDRLDTKAIDRLIAYKVVSQTYETIHLDHLHELSVTGCTLSSAVELARHIRCPWFCNASYSTIANSESTSNHGRGRISKTALVQIIVAHNLRNRRGIVRRLSISTDKHPVEEYFSATLELHYHGNSLPSAREHRGKKGSLTVKLEELSLDEMHQIIDSLWQFRWIAKISSLALAVDRQANDILQWRDILGACTGIEKISPSSNAMERLIQHLTQEIEAFDASPVNATATAAATKPIKPTRTRNPIKLTPRLITRRQQKTLPVLLQQREAVAPHLRSFVLEGTPRIYDEETGTWSPPIC